jgi:hypothetical protein
MGGGSRVGTVMAVWDLNNNVSYVDTSTTDLNAPTSNFVWVVISTSNIIYLKAVVGSSTFNTKVSVRIIS